MATFTYRALKSDGSVADGELTAADRADAFRRLGRSGLQPVSLVAKNGGGDGAKAKAKPAAAPVAKAAPKPKEKAKDGTPANKAAPAAANGSADEAKPRRPGGWAARREAKRERDAAIAARDAKSAPPSGPVRLKRAQLVLFTEELSDLLGAGLQLEPALKIMESRDELSNLKTVVANIRQQVRDGGSFSNALRTSSSSFGELYCNLAAAGEVSGALPVILKRQAVYLQKLAALQSKVIAALIYPACLFLAVVAVSFLFVSFLMPQLVGLLQSMGRELPGVAKLLIAGSGFIKGYWWAIILLAVVAVFGFRKIVSTPPHEAKWHEQKLKMPLLGALFSRRFFVQFLETLGNLVGNGLPLLKGLELTRNATVNLYGRALLDDIIAAVGEGASLSRTMRRVGFFPPLLTDMIAVGEQTGDLPKALNRAAARYDSELEKTIERLSALMQPVILAVLAMIVGPMAYIMIQVIIESLHGLG